MENVLRELRPAVLLLNLGLRRLGGVYSLTAIQRLSPSTKIIVLTSAPKLREELYALTLGAKGYSKNDISNDLLRKAVRAVQRGELWSGRKLITILLEEVVTLQEENRNRSSVSRLESPLKGLTEKKKAIARLVAEGITNTEIARRLNISIATVKAHLTAIFRKLALSNRVQLAAFIPR